MSLQVFITTLPGQVVEAEGEPCLRPLDVLCQGPAVGAVAKILAYVIGRVGDHNIEFPVAEQSPACQKIFTVDLIEVTISQGGMILH